MAAPQTAAPGRHHRSSRAVRLAVAAVLLSVPGWSAASAQVCHGAPDFRFGRMHLEPAFNLTRGAAQGAGASAGFVGGNDEFFGGVRFGRLAETNPTGSSGQVEASLGTEWSFGTSGRLMVCPEFGYDHQPSHLVASGPSVLTSNSAPGSTMGSSRATGKVSMGFLAFRDSRVQLLPFIGAAVAQPIVRSGLANVLQHDSARNGSLRTFAQGGVGLRFNPRFSLVPMASVPVGAARRTSTLQVTSAFSF